MKVLMEGSGLGQGCGHRGELVWALAIDSGGELTVIGAQGKWEALDVWAQPPGKVGLPLGVGVAVERKKKKRGMIFFFPFLRTKKIKRTMSKPEHS